MPKDWKPAEWNKLVVKVQYLNHVMYGTQSVNAYLITTENKYIATVTDESYVDLILKSIGDKNPGKELIVQRT